MTVFDKILAGKAPADVVYEDQEVLAFRDINPQAPIHVLVIPKKRVTRLEQLSEEDSSEVGRFFKGVIKVVEQLDLSREGYRVVINSGKHGQQSVDYLHAHILGGRQMSWPPG